ncbi:hypothetical protein Taro_041778 [Colocasia esculenta]|uniref:CCHC-type domain-containing protein n=1 Tax=Colocasia esculenta TaxID=4460 RepID=A0A843X172_COLES|nr:hypothetical protein [Colocasia esculenta]
MCAEDDKISLVMYMLQERADAWWSSILRTQFEGVELDVTWREFVRLFEVKYVYEHIQDKMEEKKARMKGVPEPFQRQKRKMRKLMEKQQLALVPAKTGRCLRCGSKNHRIRECPNPKKFVARDVPAAKKPATGTQAPAREYALTGDDTDDVTTDDVPTHDVPVSTQLASFHDHLH